MKVALIGFSTKEYMPYFRFYKKILDELNAEYDYFTWNRYDDNGKIEKNEYRFEYFCTENKFKKIVAFIKWKKWIKQILERNKYDKIIVLTTIPAFLLNNFLIKKYKNNYIFDYRDSTYERIPYYRKVVNVLIKNSKFSCISSKGFLDLLDDSDKIYPIHNMSYDINQNQAIHIDFNDINIGYFGIFNYYDINKKIIDTLKNENNINLYYVGASIGENVLKKYVEKNDIKNVKFKPSYTDDVKRDLYKKYKINFVNAAYGNNSFNATKLMPNKLYDSLFYKIPIIVSKNTYLEKVVNKYNIGISVDDDILYNISSYIKEFDYEKFSKNIDQCLKDMLNEQILIVNKIKEYITL